MAGNVSMPDDELCPRFNVPPSLLEELGDESATSFQDPASVCVVEHPYRRAVNEYRFLVARGAGGIDPNVYGLDLSAGPPCSTRNLNIFLHEAIRRVVGGRRFIDGCRLLPQADYVFGHDGKQWCDTVVHADRLPEFLDELLPEQRSSAGEVDAAPAVESSDACPELKIWSLWESTRRLLDEVYRDDFTKLNFTRPWQKGGQLELLASRATMESPRSEPSPSLFVAVLSRRTAALRRTYVRRMWRKIVSRSSGSVAYRFMLCRDDTDGLWNNIVEENRTAHDILILDCEEGYQEGLLTKKVLASMDVFLGSEQDPLRELFMKVDDDTFVAWSKLSKFLVNHGNRHVYAGIPIGQSVPCRNASYQWYEPYENFPGDSFPKAMAGGSGYVLGAELVNAIFETGLGEGNVLYNEDRAVGVWVDKLDRIGIKADFVNMPGIDGWWSWNYKQPTKCWSRWGQYSAFVHHGLKGVTIACLAGADEAGSSVHRIDDCFRAETGMVHQPLRCLHVADAPPQEDGFSVH